ncbi:MAG TPA: ribosome maturation factor RimM [Solirubrobacteraceae bacterium]|nr:ribosome maturation factor RimM [Solirubrobacteraceae bacterium]
MHAAPVALGAGRVGRPHGLDGSFYVTRAKPRLLSLGTVVVVAGREAAIVRRAGTEQRPILRLDGVDDRSAAEELRGLELTVQAPQAPALSEGEWWAHELQGCGVFDGERRLGAVTRMIELPSCEALEVELERGGEPLLVPMVKEAISRIEVESRRIEVDAAFLGLEQAVAPPAPDAGRRPGR